MIELQDVFRHYGNEYRSNHKLSYNQLKAMRAVETCRTAILGSHADICDECGFTRISYNSCRNRHCTKCQTLAKEKWIEARKDDLLNTSYFHVVFTLPDILNPVSYQNPEIVYDILLKSVAETLLELASDKKFLGAKLGFTEILHTWGQNLMHHPHVHCLVPGGGLTPAGKWITTGKNFFIPVKVLSRLFRGKFLYYLKKADLKFLGSISSLSDSREFSDFLSSLYQKEWVVYCKPPFKNAGYVVEYLGRYTHRVAISNNRIIKLENGVVSFTWRDYKDNNKQKIMNLEVNEFIRRFLIHVLPDRFNKIRHYGFMSSRNKTSELRLCKIQTNTTIIIQEFKVSVVDLLKKMLGVDFLLCPCCGVGHLSRASPLG